MQSFRVTLIVGFEYVGHVADGDEGLGVYGMDDVSHTGDLESVDHEIDHRFFRARITARGGNLRGTAFKGGGKGGVKGEEAMTANKIGAFVGSVPKTKTTAFKSTVTRNNNPAK
jgi:hypothetical protein